MELEELETEDEPDMVLREGLETLEGCGSKAGRVALIDSV